MYKNRELGRGSEKGRREKGWDGGRGCLTGMVWGSNPENEGGVQGRVGERRGGMEGGGVLLEGLGFEP